MFLAPILILYLSLNMICNLIDSVCIFLTLPFDSILDQSTPTEFAIANEGALGSSTAVADIEKTEGQTSKAQASTQEIVQAVIAAVQSSGREAAGDTEVQENTPKVPLFLD